MLELLRGLSEANKSLTARMDKMEQNILGIPSSNPKSQGYNRSSATAALGHSPTQPNTGVSDNCNYQQPSHPSPQRTGYQSTHHADHLKGGRPTTAFNQPFSSDARNGAIALNIDVLRRIPSFQRQLIGSWSHTTPSYTRTSHKVRILQKNLAQCIL